MVLPGGSHGKKLLFSQAQASSLRKTQKLSNPVSVHIRRAKGEIFRPGEAFRLIGVVVVQNNLPELKLTWSVSDQVQIIEGEEVSEISNVKAKKEYKVDITILTHNQENEQIHLRASALQGKMSNSAIYNTTLQKRIENEIKSLKIRTQDFSDSQKRE